MNNLQNSKIQSLGQVLTLDEMKSIFGGAIATITCTCNFSVKIKDGNGGYTVTTRPGEPMGDFYTDSECSKACSVACTNVSGCINSTANYSRQTGS